MSDKQTIHIFLNQPQFLKYKKGLPFQLTKSQIEADSGKNKVDVQLPTKSYKALLKSLQQGRGFRFSPKNVVGGSLWGTFKKGISQVGSFVKKNVKAEDVKKGLDFAMKYAPVSDSMKDVGKTLLDAGVDQAYDPESENKSFKDNALTFAKNKKVQKVGFDLGKQAVNKFLPGPQTATVEGEGLSKKRKFVKGSPEAKAFMASLRAKRKTNGGNLWRDVASGLIHKGLPSVGRIVGNIAGGPAGGMAGEMLGNVAGDVIGKTTGYGIHSNAFKTPYSPLVNGIPSPVVSRASKASVEKYGYQKKQRGKNGQHISGGSFLSL